MVLLLFHRQLLLMFGASENTIEYASSYIQIYSIGTIFVQMTLGMNMFITAQGFAKTGMLTVLIGAVFNIVLDPIFIYGLNMGVKGAALATILSQAVSCIWCLIFLCGKKTNLRLRKKYLPLNYYCSFCPGKTHLPPPFRNKNKKAHKRPVFPQFPLYSLRASTISPDRIF